MYDNRISLISEFLTAVTLMFAVFDEVTVAWALQCLTSVSRQRGEYSLSGCKL